MNAGSAGGETNPLVCGLCLYQRGVDTRKLGPVAIRMGECSVCKTFTLVSRERDVKRHLAHLKAGGDPS